MRTSSEPAVTSPSMSTTVAPPRSRTAIVAVASVIGAPFRARQGARRVGRDPHEVRQPRDLEDLAVVVAEPPGPHLDALGTRSREQSHDERDAGAVDVGGIGEAQRHGLGPLVTRLGPGAVERLLGAGVDVAVEL